MNTQILKEDLIKSMDLTYQELRKKLDPVFHDKQKIVSGQLLKSCFKDIGNIIQCHHSIRSLINE